MMIEVMTVRILVLVGRQLQVQTPQAACRHFEQNGSPNVRP